MTLVRFVRRPLAEILSGYDSQNNHLLYSILARLSVVGFGESAAALRLPAVIFGIVSIPLAWWFASRVAGRHEALLVALLLAVSYHHVWFSQNARGYTILLSGTLAASVLFLRMLEPGAGRRTIAAYAVVTALTLYTHVTAVFVAAAHALVWLWLAWRKPEARAWQVPAAVGAAAVLTLLLYAPVLGDFIATLTRPTLPGAQVEWKSPLWLIAETARGLARGVPGGWAALAAALIVAGMGAWSLWRRAPVALAIMVLPVALTAAAAVATSHNLWPRLFFFAAGFAVLIAVRGGFALLEKLVPSRAGLIGTAGAIAVAAGSLATVPRAWQPKQDFGGAFDWLVATRQEGDVIATVDLTRFPFESWLAAPWPNVDHDSTLTSLERRGGRVRIPVTFTTRLAATQPAVWERLQRDYVRARTFPGTVGGGAIVIMERTPRAGTQ